MFHFQCIFKQIMLIIYDKFKIAVYFKLLLMERYQAIFVVLIDFSDDLDRSCLRKFAWENIYFPRIVKEVEML
jgi:hypothetical protein